MSMKQNKMREEMKGAFINALKEEQIPWHCDWVRMGRPENAVTGKQYRGVNSIWLSYTQDRKGYHDPRWCTFKQAQKEGWKVKKGEKGARVEFWSLYDTETKQKISGGKVAELREQLGDDFYDRVKPISSVYTVFNAEQIEGIPERMTERSQSLLPEELLTEKRDVLLKNMGLSFKEGGNEAFYQPRNDQITMPEIEQFRSVYGYMSTFLHEAGHATGHESRLNRNIKNSFGTPDYAREELRAEIASAFVSQELGTIQAEPEHMENHKAYIQDWIAVLEKDPNELFAAIRDAEKISDYLMEKGEFGKEEVKEAGRVDSNTVTEQELLKKESIGKSSPAGIPAGQEQGPDMSFYASQGFDRWQMEKIRMGLEQGLDVSLYASLDFHSSQMNMILLGLQGGYDVSVYARPEFSSSQMMEILNGLEAGADIAVYADPKFSSMQMMEIRKGLEAELNVSSYANPKFSHMQMNLIREGLEEGLDVSVFARPEFNYSQMAEIKLGLNEGQDISSYCNPDMDAKEMNRIRLEQKFAPLNEQTMNLEKMSDGEIVGEISFSTNRAAGEAIQYTDAQEYLKAVREEIEYQASSGFRYKTFTKDPEIRKGIDDIVYNMYGEKNPHDMDYYRMIYNPEFNEKQSEQIAQGLKEKLDVSSYADPKLNYFQMEMIREGLKQGLDVSVYADSKFSGLQMQQILLGLQDKLDVSSYADSGFNSAQMKEIREGLKQDLDVSVYARKEYDSSRMAEFRQKIHEKYRVANNPEFNERQSEQAAQGLKDNLDVRDNSMELSTEQIYRQMSDGERELYDMSLDYGDMEGAGRILEEKRRELQQETGKDQPQQLKADPEQPDSRIDYSVIQNVAEMEIKLNLPSEERMTEWLDDNTSMFKTKSGVKASDLQKRYEEFQNHHMPLLGIQEAAKLRLVAKGRDIEGFHPDPVHLQMAQMLRGYQDNGMDIKDVIRNKIGEVMERTGQTDPDYVKNAVCSIASNNLRTYEEYKNIISSHEREMPGMERQDSIFHGNQKDGVPEFFQNRNPKTPVQGQQRHIMRGMGR